MVLPRIEDERALGLLRAYEPVIRYTRGERFLRTDKNVFTLKAGQS